MFSINKWTLKGNILNVIERHKGFLVTVNGVAKNPSLFSSDTLRIDCWVPKRLVIKLPLKELNAIGRFVFKKQDCYFVADKLM